MKSKRLTIFVGTVFLAPILILAIILLMAACTKSSDNKNVELKLSISMPASHPITVDGYEVWAKRVEEVTSGRVKVTIFPGETLSRGFNSYDATTSGVCDIAMLITPYEPKRFPLTMIMNQPLDLPNAVVSGKVAWDLYHEFPEIRAEYKEVKVLFFYSTSSYEIHTVKKPIYTKEDLEGLLLRVGGPVDNAIAEALGTVPQFLHMPDTYLALEKGVLDAHISAFGPMKGFRTADVTHFHTENANLHTSIFTIIMNLKKWNSLAPDDQEAIEEISGNAGAELLGSVFDRTDLETIQYMKDKGDAFTRLSPDEKARWNEFLKVIVEEWVEDQEAKGLPGRKILDAALRFKKKYVE